MTFRWLTLLLLLRVISCTHAQTITASSCNESDVQSALNSVTSSTTTVNIPAGICTWNTGINFAVPSGSQRLSIIGAGNQSVIGGDDATVIIDNVPHSPTDNATLQITTGSAAQSFRLSGITFEQNGTGNSTYNGVLRISGNSQSFRMDHMHFNQIYTVSADVDGWMYGAIDHSLFDLVPGSVNNGVRVGHTAWNNYNFGDGSWADSTTFGSNRFIFMEDNTFNGGAADDCNNGGRIVFRHNTVNKSFFQGHEMEDRNRGCRAVEVYDNTFNADTSIVEDGQSVDFRMGTGLVWGNTSTNAPQLIIFNNDRTNTGHGFTAAPNGWGYCGTATAASAGQPASNWDQNPRSAYGYACIDQVGRGKGNLLSQSYWPVTASWPNNALEPVYEWRNQWNAVPGYAYQTPCNTNDSNTIVANRDYYCDTEVWGGASFAGATFTGTVGTGSGTLSARPSSCTPNVAYWASDTNTLYQCTAQNTWTAYYTPYVYPHPLVSSNTAVPPAPTGLQAVVH
jgi:hypothetical protein